MGGCQKGGIQMREVEIDNRDAPATNRKFTDPDSNDA